MSTASFPQASLPQVSGASRAWKWTFAPSAFEWLFVITGGLALTLPWVLWMGEDALGRSDKIRWYFWINALISSPHVYATYVRVHRKIREGRMAWWLGFPAYFGIVGLMTVASAAGHFILVMTAVNVWQSFHYVRQSYGVGCLYGRQEKFDDHDRRFRWWAYHLVFPALIIGRWDTIYDVWGGKTYSFIPMDFSGWVINLLWCVAALGAFVAVAAELRLIRQNGARYNPASFLCYLTCMAVHIYGFVIASHFQRGFMAVTVFHSVQYLALVWLTERKQAVQRGARWAAALPNLAGFALYWVALFALGYSYENHVTVSLTSYWTQASAILLAAISAHHYTVDTVIWRRSAGA